LDAFFFTAKVAKIRQGVIGLPEAAGQDVAAARQAHRRVPSNCTLASMASWR